MNEHTPTPWTPDAYGQLRGANGVPVNTKHLGISQSLSGGEYPEATANTEIIIRAVNMHQELVDAVRAAVVLIGHPDDAVTKALVEIADRASVVWVDAKRSVK